MMNEIEDMAVLARECPMCRNDYEISLTDKQFDDYMSGDGPIQELLPDLNPMEHEFVKSGYCPDCQSMLFGSHYTSKIIAPCRF